MLARTIATTEYIAVHAGERVPESADFCCGEEMQLLDMRETSSVSIIDNECYLCGRTTHIVQNHH